MKNNKMKNTNNNKLLNFLILFFLYTIIMSGASNLGYGNVSPYHGLNGGLINEGNSHNPAMFSSNQIPGLPGLAGAKNNVDAAAGIVPGICVYKGGSKRKRKNIHKVYKMKSKNRIRKRKSTNKRHRISRKRQHGGNHVQSSLGYGQFENNTAYSNNFYRGGILSANNLGLANPAPYYKGLPPQLGGKHRKKTKKRGGNSNNNINYMRGYDNYNHFNNTTFPSRNGYLSL
jgi:hypothetical protein